MPTQREWFSCSTCASLFHAAGPPLAATGRCIGGGPHQRSAWFEYELTWTPDGDPASILDPPDDWRWCHKCHAMFTARMRRQDAFNLAEDCVGGGDHEAVGGGVYYRLRRIVPDPNRRAWEACHACGLLVHPNAAVQRCTTGSGQHDLRGDRSFALDQVGVSPTAILAAAGANLQAVVSAVGAPSVQGPPATRQVAFRHQIGQHEYAPLIALDHPALNGNPHAIISATIVVLFPRDVLPRVPSIRAVVYVDAQTTVYGLDLALGGPPSPRDRWYLWLESPPARTAADTVYLEGTVINIVAAVAE